MRGLVVAGVVVVALAGVVYAGKTAEQVARGVVENLGKGDFGAVVATFGQSIVKKLTADKLEAGWAQATAAAGAYQGIARAVVDGNTVVVTAQYENGTLDVAVKLDGESVVGLHTGALDSWKMPPYADPAKVDCADVSVGAGDKALPGAVCLPKGAGPFPLVLLVHGSGPGDRDEGSIGQMKPFRDLAFGLATRGVAVLRWDKRTHGHIAVLKMKVEDLTVKEEYLDDVLMAATFARTLPKVDPKRIFVAGHSEGGWLVPWFLKNDPALAGGITLAGNSRQLALVLPQQYRYLAMLDGKIDPMERLQLAITDEQVKRAMDPKLAPDTPASSLPLGINAKYFLSLQPYDAPALVAKIDRPLLFLQGARDYQVTVDEDLALWKKALEGHKNAAFKVYPKLNHALVPGEGKITPQEYLGGGNVAPEVVEDIAAFILKPR